MEETTPAAPQIVVIGGPNGAGKSTIAARLIPPTMAFVNADEIAKTLSDTVTDAVNVQAGRLMLRRLDELEAQRADIAIETTLASRSLAPRIQRLRQSGYAFSLFYVWVPDVEMSIARVASRVRMGGHHIPEDIIRRRYIAGRENFFRIYQPIADVWGYYKNINFGQPDVIAEGKVGDIPSADLMLMRLDPTFDESRFMNTFSASLFADRDKTHQQMEQAVLDALRDHKQAGNPVAVWEDGKVKIIQPEDILLPDEATSNTR